LKRFVEETGADELMVAAAIYDHSARLRSYEILAGAGELLLSPGPKNSRRIPAGV
jgi:hypothetical protein